MKKSSAGVRRAIDAVTRLSEVFLRRREQLARAGGVTEAQWSVLEEVATDSFMPSLFARNRDCSAAAVSKVVRQLTDKGLVHASISPRDARQRNYGLTAAGRRVLARVRAHREAAIDAVWADLDPEALRVFTEHGTRLAERLEAWAERSEPGSRRKREQKNAKSAAKRKGPPVGRPSIK